MPKRRRPSHEKVRKLVAKYPQEFICTAKNDLWCKKCCCIVNHSKSFFVESHRCTKKHKLKPPSSSSSISNSLQQTLILFPGKSFTDTVIHAFLSADIPLFKLNNPSLKALFSSFGKDLPSESLCRQRIPKLFDTEIQRILNIVQFHDIFLVLDETEIHNNKYFNILIGKLTEPSKTYLVKSQYITSAVTHQTVIHIVDDLLQQLKISRIQMCLLLTDAASYNIKASTILKEMYPRLFHVTCFAHLLHNCALRIRYHYKPVDKMIAAVQLSIVKNKTRSSSFSEIGRPPKTIITR